MIDCDLLANEPTLLLRSDNLELNRNTGGIESVCCQAKVDKDLLATIVWLKEERKGRASDQQCRDMMMFSHDRESDILTSPTLVQSYQRLQA